MEKLKEHLCRLKTEQLSRRVFYILLALTVVVFALFWLVGYDNPFSEGDFNAPLFTGLLLSFMYLLVAATIIVAIIAMVRSRKTGRSESGVVNGVPERRIRVITWTATFVLLLITFAVGSSATMTINGHQYADWLWLKLSDMLIFSSVVLLLAAVAAVVYGATKYIRK